MVATIWTDELLHAIVKAVLEWRKRRRGSKEERRNEKERVTVTETLEDTVLVCLPTGQSHGFDVRCFREEDQPFKNTELRRFMKERPNLEDEQLLLDREEIKEQQWRESNTFKEQDVWKTLARRLGATTVDILDDGQFLVERRATQILPNVRPLPLMIFSKERETIILFDDRKDLMEFASVTRFAHCNFDPHSQTSSYLVAQLLEAQRQLKGVGIAAIMSTQLFLTDETLWLQADPVKALISTSNCKDLDSEVEGFTLDAVTSAWCRRETSNLDYLLKVNELAGRKRGDLNNHPIIPWVVDFSSSKGGFRQLNRTKFRLTKGDAQLREMYQREPAHHVPEALTDIGFMVYKARRETKERLCQHVRSKWVPEEYPASIGRMYAWTPDECIPEFFEDPSLFLSLHSDMPDLKLPEFTPSPQEFVRWHREMLESEEVSQQLHHWIDLNFGFLLTGEEAVDALNVQLSEVQENVWTNAEIWPPPHLRTHGPVQLFQAPHPSRTPPNGHRSGNVLTSQNAQLNPLFMLNEKGIRKENQESLANNDSPLALFRELVSMNRHLHSEVDASILSVLVTVVETFLPRHCNDLFPGAPFKSRLERARKVLVNYASQLPKQLRECLPRLIHESTELPKACCLCS